MKKQLKYQALLSILTMLLLLVSFSAATFAWFTGSPDVNVEPVEGKIGSTGGSLLISDARDGTYDITCTLHIPAGFTNLAPVSTADLVNFYVAGEQSPEDMITGFQPGNEFADTHAIHGHVYLKATGEDCKVYLDPAKLDFGSNIQALAAMRLGLRIAVDNGGENAASTHIFRMDGFKNYNLDSAEMQATVSRADSTNTDWVVGKQGDAWELLTDPSVRFEDYYAKVDGEVYSEGTRELCTIPVDSIADVEYWLYLEGCDVNCINAVQQKDVVLQLGFYGADQTDNNTTGN